MLKNTVNKPTFSLEDALTKSFSLGIRNLERKWIAKIRNYGTIHSQLMILFSKKLNGRAV
jgi:hypothetical protein